jgi:hypothetical protein
MYYDMALMFLIVLLMVAAAGVLVCIAGYAAYLTYHDLKKLFHD